HGEVLILVGIMVCENRVGGKKRIRGVDGMPPWYCAPGKRSHLPIHVKENRALDFRTWENDVDSSTFEKTSISLKFGHFHCFRGILLSLYAV
ncbi:MAG TPA: hypothetical protein PKX98_09650, partial [Methanoregulaceae archaeon]|nr:hypothetical protein [Methanoregulaceae archaeon]